MICVDPVESRVCDFCKNEQIIATEAGRRTPIVAVFIKSSEGHVVPNSVRHRVCPDGRFDYSDFDFVDGFVCFAFHIDSFQFITGFG